MSDPLRNLKDLVADQLEGLPGIKLPQAMWQEVEQTLSQLEETLPAGDMEAMRSALHNVRKSIVITRVSEVDPRSVPPPIGLPDLINRTVHGLRSGGRPPQGGDGGGTPGSDDIGPDGDAK